MTTKQKWPTLAAGVCMLAAGIACQAAYAAALAEPDRHLSGQETALTSTPSARMEQPNTAPYQPKRANFKQERVSRDVTQVADWIIDSGNNRSLPFVVIDKKEARVFVFDSQGQLSGTAAVLLGQAQGDDSVPGIGDRPLSSIRPEERTTPAGRFVAALDHNIHGKDILWVDYAAAISMHRVITSNPKERRAQRLASPVPLEHRISYGCINVPAKFFDHVVRPAFHKTNGIVYILPEVRSTREVFAMYDVDEHAQLTR